MFWGDTISPQSGPRPVNCPGKIVFQPQQVIMTKASLHPGASSKEETHLFVIPLKVTDKTFCSSEVYICTLSQLNPHQDLELHFDKDDEVAFVVRGPGTVSVTGHIALKYHPRASDGGQK